MSFEFPLAEEKVKKQQIIALHLIFCLALIVTGAILLLFSHLQQITAFRESQHLFFTPAKWQGWVMIIVGLVFIICIIAKNKLFIQKHVNRVLRIFELLIMIIFSVIAALSSFNVPAIVYGMIALAILFAIYWETVSDNTLYITVDEKGIKLPVTSRRRTLAWWEIQHVIFRFGILTIDCYDNRLFQWNISNASIDKEAFQHFCITHISENSEKHIKNNW